jgi:uroporphyrinogen-III synthase
LERTLHTIFKSTSFTEKENIFWRRHFCFYRKNAVNEKHRDENFLIATADHLRPEWSKMFEQAKLKHSSAVFVKVVNSDLKTTDLSKYQLIAFYSALDVASLKANYPAYKQGDTMFVTFGNSAQKAMQAAKLKTTLAGPRSRLSVNGFRN